MAKLVIIVSVVSDDSTTLELKEMEIKFDDIRKTPNPRQALTAHFMSMTREAIAEVDPTLSI